MKIKVKRRFFDRANEMITREAGEVYEAPEERAEFLIRLGLAEKAPDPDPEPAENEAAEAPNSDGETAVRETPTGAKKTSNKGKKAAE